MAPVDWAIICAGLLRLIVFKECNSFGGFAYVHRQGKAFSMHCYVNNLTFVRIHTECEARLVCTSIRLIILRYMHPKTATLSSRWANDQKYCMGLLAYSRESTRSCFVSFWLLNNTLQIFMVENIEYFVYSLLCQHKSIVFQ